MNLLNWDGIEEDSSLSLRDVIEHMRRAGALAEMLGRLRSVPTREGEACYLLYTPDLAAEVMGEAAGLVQALGKRALALLDAQAAPPAPTPIRQPRERTARRRAA